MRRKRESASDLRPWIALVTVVIAAGIVVWLLMVPNVLGVADNGDFQRVIGASGLTYPDVNETYSDRYFGYAHRLLGYSGFTSGGYVSTHVLLVALAGGIGRIINFHLFDIRVLGACYLVFMLFAFALFVSRAPKVGGKYVTAVGSALTGGLLIFVFGDVGYTAYFQSFFGEPYALIGMLLTAAAALAMANSSRPSAWLFGLFTAAAIAVATSKIQNAPLGFALAFLGWRLLLLRPDRFWRRRAWTGIGLLTAASLLMILLAPYQLKHINLYQSIFYGVLKDSPDVSRDMKELGIPDKYRGLAGTNFFQKDTIIPQTDPTLRKEVLEKLGHRDILFYYIRHPSRFISKLERAAENGTSVRPYYLGNYDKDAGYERSKLSYSFSTWSQWKQKHIPHKLAWFAAVYAAYYLVLALWWRLSRNRSRRMIAETLAVIGIIGIMACVCSLMGDGEADMSKHLFMFNVSFDMMVVSVLMGAVYGTACGITALMGKRERGTSIDARQVRHN